MRAVKCLVIVFLAVFIHQPARAASTLVLYDSTGPFAFLGETYAIMAQNLASHFGSVSNVPVQSYKPGQMARYTGVIYLGSTFDEPLPPSFLKDVLTRTNKVLWCNWNIWQLTAADTSFYQKYGWIWGQFSTSQVAGVQYKGRLLTRSPLESNGIMNYSALVQSQVTVLATAQFADGQTSPWAIRSRNLTYVGEIPLTFISERDRYLIFADLLFDLLAPRTTERHRALLRLEDVDPNENPDKLTSIANYLKKNSIPFGVGVIPSYRDPLGVFNNGAPVVNDLDKKESIAKVLRQMTDKNGTLIQHGWTHQYSNLPNPYDGVSGDDFEFYRTHLDPNGIIVMDGPVPEDSLIWAGIRMIAGREILRRAKLPTPAIFEFPHYAASVTDYKVCAALYAARYDRALYFPGLLSGGAIRYDLRFGQFFPYVVTDIYGSRVIPENLGHYGPPGSGQQPRSVADLLAAADANLVVRDSFASFFYHADLGTNGLAQIVDGIRAMRYKFISPQDLLDKKND